MKFITFLFAFPALLSVYVLSERSWETFSRDFPLLTNSTAGPYVFLFGCVLYGYAVKRAFGSSRDTTAQRAEDDPLTYVGVQLSALSVLGSSFVYSFSVVNESVALKYFMLVIALLVAGVFGLFYFTAQLKELDSNTSSKDSAFLTATLDTKKLLYDSMMVLQGADDRNYLQEQIVMLTDIDRRKDMNLLADYLGNLLLWFSRKQELKSSELRIQTILAGVERK